MALLLPNRVCAQWYTAYGVTNINELTEAQCNLALDKATKISTTGTMLTVLGGIVAIGGGIAYSSALSNLMSAKSLSEIERYTQNGLYAAAALYCGGGVLGIGIPIWIAGAMRKSDVEIALAKFKTNVSWSPVLLKNQLNGYGLGISLSFTF